MTDIKLIVAGSRGFNSYQLLSKKLDYFLCQVKPDDTVTIISGTAQGGDRLGERYAKEKGYELIKMPADWERFKKSAGYRRNEEMAKIATHCVLFWDQKSPGTKHMADIAERYGLPLRIVRYTTDPGYFDDVRMKVLSGIDSPLPQGTPCKN